MLLPSGASSRTARRDSVKICKDFEELEKCMDPLHVLDVLSLDHKRTKVEEEDERKMRRRKRMK